MVPLDLIIIGMSPLSRRSKTVLDHFRTAGHGREMVSSATSFMCWHMATTGVSLLGRAANMRPIMPWHMKGKDNSSCFFLFLGLNQCSKYMYGFAAFLPPVQGAAGLRVCRAAMIWPGTVGSAINLSSGGRGAMPTVFGTCAGAIVVTVRVCVLAIGSGGCC